MKNYVYNRTVNEKFSIKGYLTDDGKKIEYVNSDKEEASIDIDKILDPFKNLDIVLTVSVKTDTDLSEEFESEAE